MTFDMKLFRRISVRRSDKWLNVAEFGRPPLMYWSNALAGETGEVCNAVKKYERVVRKMRQNKGPQSLDEAKTAIAKEIADVYTYLDLLAAELDIDIGEVTAAKFNEISIREGFTDRYPEQV